MKVRKIPVVVEAELVEVLLHQARTNWAGLPGWFRDSYEAGGMLLLNDSIVVKTLEGAMAASPGDWIIRGVKGELYPCKPDVFAATYESAEGGGR